MKLVRSFDIDSWPSLNHKIVDSNEYHQFTNYRCTLPASLCTRVCAQVDIPEVLSSKTYSPKENLQHISENSEDSRIYYVESNLLKQATRTKQHGPTKKVYTKASKRANEVKSDPGHEEINASQQRSNEMLSSFVVWVNGWTETMDCNLVFAKVKTYFEKLVPEK